jgi:hypothetical protein
MAFCAVEIKKGAAAEAWVSQVIAGVRNTVDEGMSVIANVFEVVEATSLAADGNRLFLVRSSFNIPAAIWFVGLVASVSGYVWTGRNLFIALGLLAIGCLYLFTSRFLQNAVRLSLRKAGYSDTKEFYNAEQVIGMIGLRAIASVDDGGLDL